MAQGKLKKKASSVAKKAKTQKKSMGPKKGARVIKPKKVTKRKVVTVKKKLEVQVRTSIEAAAVSQATKHENKPLKVVKERASAVKKPGKGKANKAGKK